MAAGIFKNLDNQLKKKSIILSLQRLGRLLWYSGVPLGVLFFQSLFFWGGKQREFLNFPILRLSLQNPRIIKKKKKICNKRNGGYGNLWCRQHSLIGDSSSRPV
jgi:hypothetical protein